MGFLDFIFGRKKNADGTDSVQRSGHNPNIGDHDALRDCPNCGKKLKLSMERCSNCGVRIKSMFRMRCPNCNTVNDIDAKHCSKCIYDFSPEAEVAHKTFYTCPICGYKSEFLSTSCVACGTRFS